MVREGRWDLVDANGTHREVKGLCIIWGRRKTFHLHVGPNQSEDGVVEVVLWEDQGGYELNAAYSIPAKDYYSLQKVGPYLVSLPEGGTDEERMKMLRDAYKMVSSGVDDGSLLPDVPRTKDGDPHPEAEVRRSPRVTLRAIRQYALAHPECVLTEKYRKAMGMPMKVFRAM